MERQRISEYSFGSMDWVNASVENAKPANAKRDIDNVATLLNLTSVNYFHVQSISDVTSLTNIRLPEIAGCAQVALSATE